MGDGKDDAETESFPDNLKLGGMGFLLIGSVLLMLGVNTAISALFGGAGIGIAISWFATEAQT